MATCYRHPNRETGVSCSNCGNPICPDCMTPTPVGMRCPDCARQKTRTATLQSMANARELQSRQMALIEGALIEGRITPEERAEFARLAATRRHLYDRFAPILLPELRRIGGLPDVMDRIRLLGGQIVTSEPEALIARVRTDIARWRDLSARANIRIE